MPDRRKHRGANPDDQQAFGLAQWDSLRQATADLCWLADHGYAAVSSQKLVGDRYTLSVRQRTAVARCACSQAQAQARRARQVAASELGARPLWIDGYNVLTTVEAALGGGVVVLARDGVCRDMASMHGSFRKVEETEPALRAIGGYLARYGVAACVWLFDRPVSNSGRLKTLVERLAVAEGWPWRVELAADPDRILCGRLIRCEAGPALALPADAVIATADSAVLDDCGPWLNLAREVIEQTPIDAWLVDLAQ